jgi:hypothetical protein
MLLRIFTFSEETDISAMFSQVSNAITVLREAFVLRASVVSVAVGEELIRAAVVSVAVGEESLRAAVVSSGRRRITKSCGCVCRGR